MKQVKKKTVQVKYEDGVMHGGREAKKENGEIHMRKGNRSDNEK